MHDDIERVYWTAEEIESRIDAVARQVTDSYAGSEFTVVSVLKGSCVFASDLIRRIPIPLALAFAAAESYRSGTVSGRLELRLLPSEEEVSGRRVLLVDDILDSGRTLFALRSELRARGAADVRVCVLLDKRVPRAVEVEPDFRAFEVENVFVVGYGLDFAGRYRNLPYIGSLKPAVYAPTRP